MCTIEPDMRRLRSLEMINEVMACHSLRHAGPQHMHGAKPQLPTLRVGELKDAGDRGPLSSVVGQIAVFSDGGFSYYYHPYRGQVDKAVTIH